MNKNFKKKKSNSTFSFTCFLDCKRFKSRKNNNNNLFWGDLFFFEGIITDTDAFGKDSRRTSSFARKPKNMANIWDQDNGVNTIRAMRGIDMEPITFLHVEA